MSFSWKKNESTREEHNVFLLQFSGPREAENFAFEWRNKVTSLERATLGPMKKVAPWDRLLIVEAPVRFKRDFENDTRITHLEENIEIESFSIIPKEATSLEEQKKNPLSLFQWGDQYRGQNYLSEIDDITGVVIKGSKEASLGLTTLPLIIDQQKVAILAVIDSGADIDHPDLKNQLAKNLVECSAEGDLLFRPTEDRDGNGIKGDCVGVDFTKSLTDPNVHRPIDELGHGTHVAGIIAAGIDNGLGIRGLHPQLRVMPLKVFSGKRNQISGPVTFTDLVLKAVLYAIEKKVDVINLSLGWPKGLDSPLLRKVFQQAAEQNILIVAASGNNSAHRPIYPCQYREVICVGSVRIDGEISSFSNFGSMTDVLAPGEGILSLYPTTLEPQLFSDKGYDFKNGTSQAAPYVSGLLAMMKLIAPKEKTPWDYYRALVESTRAPRFVHEMGYRILSSSYGTIHRKALDLIMANDGDKKPFSEIRWKNLGASSLIVNKEGRIRLPLTVRGEWGQADQAEISLLFETRSSDLRLKETVLKKTILKQNGPLFEETLTFFGEIVTTSVNAQQYWKATLHVSFLKEGVEIFQTNKDFDHTPVLMSSFMDHEKVVSFPFSSEAMAEKLVIRNAQKKLQLKMSSVFDRRRNREVPLFQSVSAETRGNEKGQRVYLWRLDKKTKKLEKNTDVFIPGSERILQILVDDFNRDGVEELMILGQFSEKKGEETKRGLLYSFFKLDGTPFFKKKGRFEHIYFKDFPEYAILDLQNYGLVSDNKGHWRFIFSYNGRRPKEQFSTDSWSLERDDVENRLYSLEMIPDTEKVKLTLLNDGSMLEELKKRLGPLKWQDEVILTSLIPQSSKEKRENETSLRIFIGFGAKRRHGLLKIQGGREGQGQCAGFNRDQLCFQYTEEKLALSLYGLTARAVHRLSNKGSDYFAGQNFLGALNDTTLQLFSPRQNTMASGIHDERKDHLRGLLDTFETPEGTYYLAQTKGHLLSFFVRPGERVSRPMLLPLHRVSFVTQDVFTELFFPVVTANQGPGLYVDVSLFHDRQIYTASMTPEGIKIPLHDSLAVPEDCQAMNPLLWNGVESVALICLGSNEEASWQIRPIEGLEKN
jgi:hypothetical protein